MHQCGLSTAFKFFVILVWLRESRDVFVWWMHGALPPSPGRCTRAAPGSSANLSWFTTGGSTKPIWLPTLNQISHFIILLTTWRWVDFHVDREQVVFLLLYGWVELWWRAVEYSREMTVIQHGECDCRVWVSRIFNWGTLHLWLHILRTIHAEILGLLIAAANIWSFRASDVGSGI